MFSLMMHSDSKRGNLLLALHGLLFQIGNINERAGLGQN